MSDQPESRIQPSTRKSSSRAGKALKCRKRHRFCRYCYEANEAPEVYKSHFLVHRNLSVKCPRLWREGCSVCGARGAQAHPPDMCKDLPALRENYKHMVMRKRKMRKSISLRLRLLKRLGKRCARRICKFLNGREVKRLRREEMAAVVDLAPPDQAFAVVQPVPSLPAATAVPTEGEDVSEPAINNL